MATVLGKLGSLTLWLLVKFAQGESVTRSLEGEKGGGVWSLSSLPGAAVRSASLRAPQAGASDSPQGASPPCCFP